MLIAIAALALIAALSTTAAYGAFTSPLQLSAPGDVGQPQVATDAEGGIVAVWAAPANGGGHKAVFRQISADGTLGPVRFVGDLAGNIGGGPLVAAAPGGTSVVAWVGGGNVAHVRSIGTGGALGHVLNVSRPGHITFNLDLATATNGSSVLVWAEPVLDRDEQIHARTITSAGTLGPPRTLSQPDVIEPPRVAIDADGNAIAVWTRALPTYGTRRETLSPSGDLGPVFAVLSQIRRPRQRTSPTWSPPPMVTPLWPGLRPRLEPGSPSADNLKHRITWPDFDSRAVELGRRGKAARA